jgi:hypothetical protein
LSLVGFFTCNCHFSNDKAVLKFLARHTVC